MTYLLNSQLEIFAFLICAILLFDIVQHKEDRQFDDNIFLALLIANMIILLIDALGWAIDGNNTPLLNEIHLRTVLLILIMNPILPLLWLLYIDYYIFKDKKRIRQRLLPYMIPFFLILILLASNPFTNALFFIDSNNVYHRGSLFPVFMMLTMSYMVYSFMLILKNHALIGKQFLLSLLIFPLPPLLGTTMQVLHYGVATIWTSLSLSLLIVYINVQNRRLDTDYLTMLFNRRRLDQHLHNIINKAEDAQKFSAIMFDIDGFKRINDQYGHIEGDVALEITANILRSSLRKGDFLARYGGDEFMAIIDIDNLQSLEETVARINNNFAEFNQATSKPYKLSVSTGYDLYNPKCPMSADQFIKRLDTLMYENKNKKKAALAADGQAVFIR